MSKRRVSVKHYTWLAGWLWFMCVTAWADEAGVVALSHDPSQSLNSGIQYLRDEQGELTIQTLLASDRRGDVNWQQHSGEVFNQGYSNDTWWLKARIDNPLEERLTRVLEVSYSVLDHLTIYVEKADRVERVFYLGDKIPFYKRPVDHRFFLVPLEWQPGETFTLYFQVRSSSSVQVPLTLWQPKAFHSYDTTRTLIQGFYFGTMIVIAIYNLLVFFVLGDRNYLYYVGYVVCMPLFLASLNGWSFQYLWPAFTTWNDQSILVALSGVVVFGALFTRRFLQLEKFALRLDQAFRVVVLLALAVIVASFVMPYRLGIRLIIPLASVACLMGLAAGILIWSRGQHTAKYYTIAWSTMLLGGIILALSKYHIIPSNTFTEYATQLGSALEVVLLSFALAERINEERRLRYEAQAEALTTQRRVNDMLEKRVHERTLALEQANQKLLELSATDQLTGLKNRRYLDAALQDEYKRCERYQRCLSIMILDIDFFKNVNDTHGHLVGDEVLKEVAARLQDCLRWPMDKIARYGGEEFCIVLPETGLSGSMSVAERIRSSVEATPIKAGELEIPVTISVGVYAAVPNNEKTISQMLERADQALYLSKEHGRNRVTAFPGRLSSVAT